jgi:hypothetical protein
MSRESGHFCFAASPSLLERGGKTKMIVSEANGHSLFAGHPSKGSAQLIPLSPPNKIKPRKGHFYLAERANLALLSGWNKNDEARSAGFMPWHGHNESVKSSRRTKYRTLTVQKFQNYEQRR